MPYGLRKKGKKFQVYNKATGHVYSNTTQSKAKRQMALLEGIEHGSIKPKKSKRNSKGQRKHE